MRICLSYSLSYFPENINITLLYNVNPFLQSCLLVFWGLNTWFCICVGRVYMWGVCVCVCVCGCTHAHVCMCVFGVVWEGAGAKGVTGLSFMMTQAISFCLTKIGLKSVRIFVIV